MTEGPDSRLDLFGTDSNGNMIWEQSPVSEWDEESYDALCLENEGYLLTGQSSGKVVLLRVDKGGEM